MAIKTQLRLAQLTGSVNDLKPASVAAGVAAGNAAHADLEDVLQYYAQAVSNIHGNVEFGAQTPGQFNQDIFPNNTNSLIFGKRPSVVGSSWAGNTPNNSGFDSSTTAITFSGTVGASVSGGSYFIVIDGSGNTHVYQVSSASSGDSSITVLSHVAEASTASYTISSPSSFETASSLSRGVAWKKVYSREFKSNYHMEIETFNDGFGNGDITLTSVADINATASDQMILSASNLAGLHGSALDLTADGVQGIGLKASGGGLLLSGALGLSLMADGDHNGAVGGVPFSLQGEGTTFISNFSADTSVLGALNTLYSANVDTAQTKIVKLVTGSWSTGHPEGLPVGSSDDDVTVHGTFAAVDTSVAPHEVDVFVNGQLMLSGTATGATAADYFVSDSNAITFKFDLVADDVVVVTDKR